MKKTCVYSIAAVLLGVGTGLCAEPGAPALRAPETAAAAEAPGKNQEPQYAGKFFDTEVLLSNYYFVKSVFLVFGNGWDPKNGTPEQLESLVWDELLLSYEAFRRGIEVNRQEVEDEVKKIIDAEKAKFDFKADKETYAKWVKEKTNESVELFENQILHMSQMRTLKVRVMESLNPPVTDQEARQEFLDEYNTLGVDLAEFSDKTAAQAFYRQALKDRKFWDAEKSKNPASFKRPGFVSLEFLMEIWKIPRTACYRMMRLQKNDLYQPEPIYKGYAVFRVFDKRPAKESDFSKRRDGFREKIRVEKKLTQYADWFSQLKKDANTVIYKKEGGGK